MGMSAQDYNGSKGLLQVPSAEMDSSGTFRGGGYYLDKRFTPASLMNDGIKYNTGGYFISMSPWKWIDLSLCFTLLKMHKNKNPEESVGYYNEDRRMSLKLHPLYEGKWWPALAVGVDDLEQSLEKWLKHKGGTYFHNYYIVASKHFDIKGYELGTHLAYRYYTSELNKNRRGLAGGVTLRPAFYRPLRVVAEWDGVGVNVGADVLLWRHLFIQAALVHGKGFMGGVSYHYTIKF